MRVAGGFCIVFVSIGLAWGATQARAETFDPQPFFDGENVGGAHQEGDSHACPGNRVAMAGLHLADNDFLCISLPTLQKDTGTVNETNHQDNNMLTCPSGSYMVGAHGQNRLLCRSNPGIHLGPNQVHNVGSNIGYDGGRHMHGCNQISGQPIMVLTGIQDSQNLLNCAPIQGFTNP
jgi:hypothetical protein